MCDGNQVFSVQTAQPVRPEIIIDKYAQLTAIEMPDGSLPSDTFLS